MTPTDDVQCLIGLPHRSELVDLLALPKDAVQIIPIMRTLSNLNRFSGRGSQTVSVMTHSAFVAFILQEQGYEKDICLGGLCHDFGEAFVGDMISPVKDFFPGFKWLEQKVMSRIAELYHIGRHNSLAVKNADMIALAYEAKWCGFDVSEWNLPFPPSDEWDGAWILANGMTVPLAANEFYDLGGYLK